MYKNNMTCVKWFKITLQSQQLKKKKDKIQSEYLIIVTSLRRQLHVLDDKTAFSLDPRRQVLPSSIV